MSLTVQTDVATYGLRRVGRERLEEGRKELLGLWLGEHEGAKFGSVA